MSNYQPGTCNIGAQEIRRRQAVAVFGALVTLLVLAVYIKNGTPSGQRIWIFFPAMAFTTGLVQARSKFCLAYGFKGAFNLGKLGELSKVITPEDRKADKAKAIKILMKAADYAAIIAAIVYLLPIS